MTNLMRICRPLVAVVPLALCACGPDNGGSGGGACDANLIVGDLVITEIYPDAPGDDSGNEWFEIYNATSSSVSLKGITLLTGPEDMSSEKTHKMSEVVLLAGEYAVLGGVLDEFKPDFVKYGYGDTLGSLRNSAGRIALLCGEAVVDEVTYADSKSGASLQLSGAIAPDHIANDSFENFCESAQNAFLADQFGTPGAANESCAPVNQNVCNDNGTMRDVVKPQVGDIEISEIMADAVGTGTAGADLHEWIELRVNSNIDLNGLQMGRAEPDSGPGSVSDTVASVDCLPAVAGEHILFIRSLSAAENGGVEGGDFLLNFNLVGSDDGVFIGIDDTVLDLLTYSSFDEGVALQVDSAGGECAATSAYGDSGNLGTPGGVNIGCPIAGQCFDTDTQQMRPIVSPAAFDVLFNEWMPSPTKVGATAGEWIEFWSFEAVDLNGMTLSDGPDRAIDSGNCLHIPAGGYFVIARSTGANGGVPEDLVISSFTLTAGETLELKLGDGTVIDSVTYSGAASGKSLQFAVDGTGPCDGTATYGDGDLGTPGAENDATCI